MRGVVPGVGGVVLGFALGCGGVSVAPRAHLDAVCAAAGPFPVDGDLGIVDAPVRPIPYGRPLVLDAIRVELDGVPVDGSKVTSAVRTALEEPGAPLVVVVPTADTPAERVRSALEGFAAAGVPAPVLVRSTTPSAMPPPPDPEYARELRTLLDVGPSQRATLGARETEELIALCPGAQEVFRAVAVASSEHRCMLLAAGMDEALPNCPFTDGDRVITAIQVLMGPEPDEAALTWIELRFDPSGDPVDLGTGTWGEVAPSLAARSDRTLNLGL